MVDEALALYEKAEPLYVREQDGLGLANLYQSKGDLKSRLDLVDEARLFYEQALALYKKEKESMGAAYTIGELCIVYATLGLCELAGEMIAAASTLNKKLPQDVKDYVNRCVQGAEKILKTKRYRRKPCLK